MTRMLEVMNTVIDGAIGLCHQAGRSASSYFFTGGAGMKRAKRTSPMRRLMGLIGAALLVAALVKELSRPAGERTWHGTVARVVPYDFRLPTLARLHERMWAPEDPHLLTPQVFGVGWSVNLGRLVGMLRTNREQVSEASAV